MEIQDISISQILDQYLAWLEARQRLDLEVASEFITMASHLMLIKTKMLLSAAEQAEAESELDFNAFNEQDYSRALAEKNKEKLTYHSFLSYHIILSHASTFFKK